MIPKSKRLKRKAKPGEEEEEEIGTKIEQSRTQVADVGPTPFTKSLEGTKQPDFLNIDRTKYKIWKPWLPETNVPKWAEELQEADLSTVLTKDSKAGK